MFNFQQLMEKHSMKIRGVIQVGAHHGQECAEYSKCGIETMVLYEPHPDSFRTLQDNAAKYPKAIAINKGLGSSKKVIHMQCSKSNQGMSNSFLIPKDHTEIYPHILFDHTIPMEVDTLDCQMQFIKNEVKSNLNFLSMDVQGFEMEVLLGGENTLSQIDYIVTEINTRPMYENCVMVDELDMFLSQRNFVRVETTNTNNGWGDALYINMKENKE